MRWLLVLALSAACGDNHACDWAETDDTANEMAPEMTSLALGETARNLCGAIDGGHASGDILDIDRYRVTVGGDGRLLVEIAGGDGAALLEGIEVRIFDTKPAPTLLGAGTYDPKLAELGAFLADVTPGDYEVWVSARAAGALSGAIDYRVRITADHTDDCVADPTAYAEAHDGADDSGNDAIAVDYAKPQSFTAMPGTPEPTGLVVAAASKLTIDGSSGTAPRMDQYLDRDTYALATDETTNELTVKLAWMPGADLDYLVFEAGKMVPVGAGQLASTSASEVATFPVRPSTTYWLWVGRFAISNGQPAPYRATVCGGHFFD